MWCKILVINVWILKINEQTVFAEVQLVSLLLYDNNANVNIYRYLQQSCIIVMTFYSKVIPGLK